VFNALEEVILKEIFFVLLQETRFELPVKHQRRRHDLWRHAMRPSS